jgi:hypothetical protein
MASDTGFQLHAVIGGLEEPTVFDDRFTVDITSPIDSNGKTSSAARVIPAVSVHSNFHRMGIKHLQAPEKQKGRPI